MSATPADRRFAGDAEAHRRDAPRHCRRCAGGLDLATEFWEGPDRRLYCWCDQCGWTGEIATTGDTAVGHEPGHEDRRIPARPGLDHRVTAVGGSRAVS